MSLKKGSTQKVSQAPARLPVRSTYGTSKEPYQSYHAPPQQQQQQSSRQHSYDDSMSMKGMQKALPRDKKQSNKPVPISHGVSYQPVKDGRYQKTEKPVSSLKGGNYQSRQPEEQTQHYGGSTSSHMSSSSYDW